jgi:hypothetical protein
LGDQRDRTRGTQSTERLVHEVAYEHWHRMLFARFLAENGLLIEPDSGVAVTMEECEELAREAGEEPRAMAARFAERALPQIFRSGDPVLEVTLAPETRQALDRLLDSLPSEVFVASDSLGWTYQFWQSEKKDEVNKSGVKIGADELPAVTQLFTEHYMVLFLYHNTIGAWHAGKVLASNSELAQTAADEEELRKAVRLTVAGGYDFQYLRFVRTPEEGDEEDAPTGPWRPAAGSFDGWPKTAKELKVLDPCCGSGHFLVEGLELLVRLRMREEDVSLENAIAAVIGENLHGLEIDPRCTQIAAFNVALAAWKLGKRPMGLPPMHIACSGLAVGSTKKEWTTIAGADERLRAGMDRLYDLFKQAPQLGSLIQPTDMEGDLLVAGFNELQPLLERALGEAKQFEDTERAVTARGMSRAAALLSNHYTLVITNVPFLTEIKFSAEIAAYVRQNFPEGRPNLATAFAQRMIALTEDAGGVAFVSPQSWWFLSRYKSLRASLLRSGSWHFLVRLGERAFRSAQAGGELVGMTILSESIQESTQSIAALDVSTSKLAAAKTRALRTGELNRIRQRVLLQSSDLVVTFAERPAGDPLDAHATALAGCTTSDSPRFIRKYWELPLPNGDWELYQTTAASTRLFGGMSDVIFWQQEKGALYELAESVRELNHASQNWRRGKPNWGKRGVVVSQMGHFPATIYDGNIYDPNCCAIVPKTPDTLTALWAFCSSPEFHKEVRRINQNRKVEARTFLSISFDADKWRRAAATMYPQGLPEPHSNDPTQWLFHGHPANAEARAVLQVGTARLLGYRWPVELDMDMRLTEEARGIAEQCDALERLADQDGIVCLSPTRGERSAADRLRELLSEAFGATWSATTERELLGAAGNGKKKAETLDLWLRDCFFEEHCKLFHHRPFIWHIWDGNKHGFSVLVNGHKLCGPNGEGRRTLKTLTYSYLGDWIERQTVEQRAGKEGADARLAAAQDLQAQLEKILVGEPPYDVFVRWKPLHGQTIGWDPDINDGVRLNIRPFTKAELRTGGKKGAGVLRWKPTIKWKKDRGKEPERLRDRDAFPWFWSCPGDGTAEERTDFAGRNGFDGNRWNDLHYTSDAKRTARAKAEEAAQ